MTGSDLGDLVAGRTAVAHLATAVDGRPHVAPVWYGYDDDTLTVLTGGRKLENLKANPRVALSIQRDDEGVMEWMATVRGTASVTEDPDAVNAAARRVYTHYLGEDLDDWAPVHRAALSDDPNVALVEVDVGSAAVRAPEA